MPAHPSVYQFLAEALLYPEDRDAKKLAWLGAAAGAASPDLREAIVSMLADAQLDNCDTYLQTFEIAAQAPLYLGHYLYEEPKNCRAAAISGRNAYMIQLKNLYRHFGLEIQGGELPDFLPLMLDFLAMTATHPDQKRRHWMIQQYVFPALPALANGLRAAHNVYSRVAGILEQMLRAEAGEAPVLPPEIADAAAPAHPPCHST